MCLVFLKYSFCSQRDSLVFPDAKAAQESIIIVSQFGIRKQLFQLGCVSSAQYYLVRFQRLS